MTLISLRNQFAQTNTDKEYWKQKHDEEAAAAATKVGADLNETMQYISLFGTGVFGLLTMGTSWAGGRGGDDENVQSLKTKVENIYSRHGVSNLSELQALVTKKKTELETKKSEADAKQKAYNESNEKINGTNGYAAQIKTLTATLESDNTKLETAQEDLKTLQSGDPKKIDQTAVQNKQGEIKQLQKKIQEEKNKIKNLNEKIKQEDLEKKKTDAQTAAKEVEALQKEYQNLSNDFQLAQGYEKQIKEKEGNVEKTTEEQKSFNKARNEFEDALKAGDINNPSEDLVNKAKALKEICEKSSDPSVTKAYNAVLKSKVETILKNAELKEKSQKDTPTKDTFTIKPMTWSFGV